MGLTFTEALNKAVKELREKNFEQPKRMTFYTGGSGFTDEACVEHFKGTGVVVVTRDGKQWYNGELMEEN